MILREVNCIMEFGEPVYVGDFVNKVADLDEKWVCPFSHGEQEKTDGNVLPPRGKNDAAKLRTNLKKESKHLEDLSISLLESGKKSKVQFSAHHILPGNESWRGTHLRKWIHKENESHVKADIGYDVNAATNGISLPGGSGVKGWSKKTNDFQLAYSEAAMNSAEAKLGEARQFHDRHPAYSEFVVKTLDKVAAKLDGWGPKGCRSKKCSGKAKTPNPPYKLKARIDAIAKRLSNFLRGSPSTWRRPLFTSRFAVMYTFKDKNLTQDQARKALTKDNFVYEVPKEKETSCVPPS